MRLEAQEAVVPHLSSSDAGEMTLPAVGASIAGVRAARCGVPTAPPRRRRKGQEQPELQLGRIGLLAQLNNAERLAALEVEDDDATTTARCRPGCRGGKI